MTKKNNTDDLGQVRFGLIAIRKGFVTQEQLVRAFEIQVLEELEFGTHRKIGEILSGQGIMSSDQVEDVLNDISRGHQI